ncbi:hypothetical protein [Bradyrhizobium liaoningense]
MTDETCNIAEIERRNLLRTAGATMITGLAVGSMPSAAAAARPAGA